MSLSYAHRGPMPPNSKSRNTTSNHSDSSTSAVVHVCQSGTCRRKGSDAALVEIEELASLVIAETDIDVSVEPTGCLGYCRRGPAVAVETTGHSRNHPRERNSTQIYVGVNTLEKSATVVEGATGVAPALESMPSAMERRLSVIRETKQREYLVKTYQWNKALQSILRSAGDASTAGAGSTSSMVGVKRHRRNGNRHSDNSNNFDRFWKEVEGILSKAGYQDVSPGELLVPKTSHKLINLHMLEDAKASKLRCMPDTIDGYVPWTLRSVEVVTRHSAVFKFETKNPKRGTPHPRGRGRLPKPKTWHITMLGELFSPFNKDDNNNFSNNVNNEGPLPWVERDYTPISSGLDWERGTCDILIKVYNDGRLTRWLAEKTKALCDVQSETESPQEPTNTPPGDGPVVLLPREETKIWLSKPVPTLSLPSLNLDSEGGGEGFQPKSVLLLLAGTGIVAVPQILAHREPARLLGISTQKRNTLPCPIDLIHSCREDDLLMLPELRDFCRQGNQPQHTDPRRVRFRGLRNYTLLLSPGGGASTPAPFDSVLRSGSDNPSPLPIDNGDDEERCRRRCESLVGELPNARYQNQRLDRTIVANALRRMVHPCRVVVSGPDAYNDAARRFVEESGALEDLSKQLTILSA